MINATLQWLEDKALRVEQLVADDVQAMATAACRKSSDLYAGGADGFATRVDVMVPDHDGAQRSAMYAQYRGCDLAVVSMLVGERPEAVPFVHGHVERALRAVRKAVQDIDAAVDRVATGVPDYDGDFEQLIKSAATAARLRAMLVSATRKCR